MELGGSPYHYVLWLLVAVELLGEECSLEFSGRAGISDGGMPASHSAYTNSRSAERAKAAVEHALRVMRTALREHPGIHDWQLRFGVGSTYSLGDSFWGWQAPNDTSWELGLSDELVKIIEEHPLATSPAEPSHGGPGWSPSL